MIARENTAIRTSQWFYMFVLLHTLAWTLVPWLTRYTLPLDAMESATWGHQLEWGYDKNPFMNPWLTALAIKLTGESALAIYLFSQLSVGLCFWAVWKLAKHILPPLPALFAVLILGGVQYYDLHAIDFDDNTLELGMWALTTLFFYQAARDSRWCDWILTGIFAGFAMMTKYYSALLLLMMLLFLATTPKTRRAFRQPQVYAAILLCVGITLPHVIWLCSHDFMTFAYAWHRISATDSAWHFLYQPLRFGSQQLATFLPAVALALLLLVGKKPIDHSPRLTLAHFDKRFLLYVGLGPFLLTLLLSLCTGITLHSAWGQPLLSLWGIIVMSALHPHLTKKRFYIVMGIYYVLFTGVLIGYAISMITARDTSSANYPGRIIAATLTREWHTQFHRPLTFVAGHRWAAGNVAFYSMDKPAVYMEWNPHVSPWISEQQLRQTGAIFIWDPAEGKPISQQAIQARFPTLQPIQIRHFTWLRDKTAPPVELQVAILPPEA